MKRNSNRVDRWHSHICECCGKTISASVDFRTEGWKLATPERFSNKTVLLCPDCYRAFIDEKLGRHGG